MRAWVLFFLALPLSSWAQQNSAFSASTILPVPTLQAVADFNMDGRADVLVAENSSLRVYLGGASGLSQGRLISDVGVDAWIVLPGDFDRDGNPDLAVIGTLPQTPPNEQQRYALRLLKGDGTGNFSRGAQLTLPEGIGFSAAADDFSLDGNLDIVLVGAPGVYFLRGDGLGSFTITGPAPGPVSPKPLLISRTYVADMNGDTKPDIIIDWSYTVFNGLDLTQSESGRGVSVGINDGTGRFSYLPTISTLGASFGGVADFTGDRSPDFLIFSQQLQVWKNSGNGQVALSTTSNAVQYTGYHTAIADFNLDGVLDFAASVNDIPGAQTYIAHGAGGTFSVQFPQLPGDGLWNTFTADFNGDRRPDLLVPIQPAPGLPTTTSQLYLNASSRTPTVSAQVISFSQPANQAIGSAPVTLRPTSNSGLPVQVASRTPATCSVWKNTVTATASGTCSLLAYQSGSTNWAPGFVIRSFTVPPPPQTQIITFPAIYDQSIVASPLLLSATASSGLPVAFTSSTTTTCTVSGSALILIAGGTCTIAASQAGDATYQAAPTVTRSFQILTNPRIDAITNAASNIPGTVAPASYAALYGANLAPAPALTLRDSSGVQRNLELSYASATQINFLLPAGLALGSATLTATTAAGSASFAINVANTVPGLFSADGSGQGPAAANVMIVNEDKSVTTRLVTDGPIPVLAGTEIYLVLYGTGIRGSNNVTARIAGRPVEVLYSGAQGAYPGLDQINLRVPLSVGGMGTVEVQLTVDGAPSNTVTINVN